MTCCDRPTTNPHRSKSPSPSAHTRTVPRQPRPAAATAALHGLVALTVILGLLLAASPAGATSFVPMSDAALAEQAPLIVIGRITAIDQAPLTGRPATDYTVSLTRVLKGAAPADPLTVRVPGGVGPDGAFYRVWGAPRFLSGDRVMLFLDARRDGTFGVSQLLLGAFVEVTRGDRALALRDLSDAVVVTRAGAAPLRERRAREGLRALR